MRGAKRLWQRFLARANGSTVDAGMRGLRESLRRVKTAEQDLRVATTSDLRRRVTAITRRSQEGDASDALVAEGMAVACEVACRALGLRMHDSQVLAALGLHAGNIVELATGEGKTLAAVPAAWLSSLSGRGVHVLTFNDYLARRDAAWMRPVYEFLGVTVAHVQQSSTPDDRRHAYSCGVTYGTAKQVGFDLLRDGLVRTPSDRVLRPLHHAIVDEADSLMIDEARLPLVLAAGELKPDVDPHQVAAVIRGLEVNRDFEVDEYARNVVLTDDGIARVQVALGIDSLFEADRGVLYSAVNLALHAQVLLHRDVDYIVRDGQVKVVDEFTGRVVDDRRWPDGLHSALEAKEHLEVGYEGTVVASLPLQHFFRLYPKLSGMTATALPAAEELRAVYGLDVVVVPSHRPTLREDKPDVVLATGAEKLRAVVAEVQRLHLRGRPVLIGTASVAESERLARVLQAASLRTAVLNAKNDEAEAAIIREAGDVGAVTISTNMAGRGTDIRLGGSAAIRSAEVVTLGGLSVLGTSRHESKRIDDQLRGRAGRQGDPGCTQFFIALDDEIIRRYDLTDSVGDFEHAQRVVEGQNAEIRRTLSAYSSMVEQQRQILAALRERVLTEGAGSELIERLDSALHGSLVQRVGPETARECARQIVLDEIDRSWSDHLARLRDIRESIHMHYLAGLDSFGGIWALRKPPLDAFREMAIAAFNDLQVQLDSEIVRKVSLVLAGDSRQDHRELVNRRPMSVWTYIVNDTPFESTVVRIARRAVHRRARQFSQTQ